MLFGHETMPQLTVSKVFIGTRAPGLDALKCGQWAEGLRWGKTKRIEWFICQIAYEYGG